MVIVPYVPSQPPSPRAQELGQRFELTIAEFEQKYPDLSAEEVRQALALASRGSAAPTGRIGGAAIAVSAGALVAVGLAGYLFAERQHAPAFGGMVAVFGAVLAVGLVMLVRSRRE